MPTRDNTICFLFSNLLLLIYGDSDVESSNDRIVSPMISAIFFLEGHLVGCIWFNPLAITTIKAFNVVVVV